MAGKPRTISIPGNAPAAPASVVEQAPIPAVVEETSRDESVEVAESSAPVVEQAPVARRKGKAVLTAEGWVV